jgi:Glyoxalase/Bleomycin resistance protein/Dioxygenase superfamily
LAGHPFTETLQIAIVVRDVNTTMQRYVDDYGIGPWEMQEFTSNDVDDLREYGEPVEHAWRVAVTTIGSVMWELIEPLDDKGMYVRFLAEKGEGVHHNRRRRPGLRRSDRHASGERESVGWQRRARPHTIRLPRHRQSPRCDQRDLQRRVNRPKDSLVRSWSSAVVA